MVRTKARAKAYITCYVVPSGSDLKSSSDSGRIEMGKKASTSDSEEIPMMENLDPQHASGQRFARLFPFSLFRRPIGPCSKRIDCNQNANTFNSKDPVYSNLETIIVKETKGLVAELCRHVYTLGWVLGTGGSITIRVHDDAISRSSQLIVMSPSGVQKDKVDPEDMFVLSSDGCILSKPRTKLYPHKPPKCTDCAPIFLKVYEMRNAGAVIHSHGIEACLVTMIHPLSKEFRITHMEMIKGIEGHGYHDELVIPIIENTAYERELTESFTKAIEAYPKTTAVLVRNHGVYIWGETWISTKTQGFILLDIDGTTSELRHSELVGVMFDEVPEVLERWYASGIKVYLYSSSSRGAQRLFFSNSNHGDLGEYICGYFDTTIGSKTEAKSYLEILLTIGVDKPEKILLVTSDFQAAMTARAAGLEVVISVRPGNSPIPETPNFKTIESLSQI
ncbi:hypothetical protein AgCh_007329 [Apium graveolens]